MIWKIKPELSVLNDMSSGTLAEHIGIQFTEIRDDGLVATMPVDNRTHQPMGILHGGASVVLAETLGSVASFLTLDDILKTTAVGLNVTADHLRPISKGVVTGIVTPIKIGKKIHLWNINIYNDKQQLICAAKLSVMIIPRN